MIAYDDIRTLTADRLVRDLGRLPRVIVGSPPCQDISSANARGRGVDGARSRLFFEAVRLIGECRPIWACLENSPTLRTRGYDRVAHALEREGYTCWPLVVGAVHAGAPHRRQRCWLIAADASQGGCQPIRQSELSASGSEPRANPERRSPGNPDGSGLEIGQGQRGHAIQELAPALGTVLDAWPQWNGGPGAIGRVDDGLPKGLARRQIAAYGDAVVPQIAEAIGRSMSALLGMHGPVLDLFSGAACGWSLGMHRAGYDIAAICEIDDWRRAVAIEHHRRMTK